MKVTKYIIYLIAMQGLIYLTMNYLCTLSDPLTMMNNHTSITRRILSSSALKTSVLILDLMFSCCCIFHIWSAIQEVGIRQRKS